MGVPSKSTTAQISPTLAQLPLTVTGALRSSAIAGSVAANPAGWWAAGSEGSQVPPKAALMPRRVISDRCQGTKSLPR